MHWKTAMLDEKIFKMNDKIDINDAWTNTWIGECTNKQRLLEGQSISIQKEVRDCVKYIESLENWCEKMNEIIGSNKNSLEISLNELKETHDLDLKETYETIRKNIETIINKI